MKYLCITYLTYILMVIFVDFIISDRQFYPNLPVGEFRGFVRFFLKCNDVSTKSDTEINLHVNKKSSTSSELVGNITFKRPFDDSITLNLNWAVKDSIGGWKDNAHILQLAKGCTGCKTILNKLWSKVGNAFGVDMKCPIPPGTYVSKGLDLSNITSKSLGIPSFFYGTYKMRISFSDIHNTNHGCIIMVCDVKRPWETQ